MSAVICTLATLLDPYRGNVPLNTATRRQARFAAGRAILPHHAAEGTWYDVCPGRRRSDDQPGMVMLDYGDRREHVPAACLEFREVRARGIGRIARPVRLARHRLLATALSLVPVGAAVIVAAHRFGWYRHN
jgi:hypothetical protein